MIQEDFGVEQFMDKYETAVEFNLGETCVDSVSISEVAQLAGLDSDQVSELTNRLVGTKLTYGSIPGSDDLKSSVAAMVNSGGGIVSPNDIVVTNGAIGANFLVFYTLVNPGDHIVVVEPCYQQLWSVPQMFSGCEVSKVPLDENNLPNIELLAQMAAKKQTKMIVVNNPNNPTGSVVKENMLEQIVDIAQKNNCYILCDEVYLPLFHSCEPVKLVVHLGYEKAISTGSMSKAFSVAGLRVGWIISNEELTPKFLCKRDYNTISVSVVDDMLAVFVLKHYRHLLLRNFELCRSNLAIMEEFIEKSNGVLSWVKPVAGTTCFIKVNADVNTMEFCEKLAEDKKTLCLPGDLFQRPGYLRIGYGNAATSVIGGMQEIFRQLGESGVCFYK